MTEPLFSVMLVDGTAEEPIKQPDEAILTFPIIDETPEGDTVVSGVGTAMWIFDYLDEVDYFKIKNKRGTKGKIRFRMLDANQTAVLCEGQIDQNPGAPKFYRGRVVNLSIEFRRVTVVT